MPALKFFGRKWLVASDDLVLPCIFEIIIKLIWLALIILVCVKYYTYTWECEQGGVFIRTYLLGVLSLSAIILVLLVVLGNRSAQGSIMELDVRKHVPLLLTMKILLIIPEVSWNIMGTVWVFTSVVQCSSSENFTTNVIKALVVFTWAQFALSIFGLALVFDPLGSVRIHDDVEDEDGEAEKIHHGKLRNVWIRRFRQMFCCIRRDEESHQAFEHVANLFTTLLRNTDLVPSDLMAALVLLRVMQKRETRELRRVRLQTDDDLAYSTDLKQVMKDAPNWVSLKLALHYLKLSIAAYGWPFVMYRYPVTGLFRLCSKMRCCACMRSKPIIIRDDNCCLCHLAGTKYLSLLETDDILYASYQNDLYQLPFFVAADHKTRSIAVVIRGSISLCDIFTDLTAGAQPFEAQHLPKNSMAHGGMIKGARFVLKNLEEVGIIDKALASHPGYDLIFTGHSLGAGVAVLVAILLRPKYPDLKVYAISPPAGLLSREACRYTESFTFSVGIGDDFVMRLGVESMENIRSNALRVLNYCKLPKYRIMMNGFGYALFGIPTQDLETIWKDDIPSLATMDHFSASSLTSHSAESLLYERDATRRRFGVVPLYTPGRILHIARRKRTKAERKAGTGGPKFEMKWTEAEDFTEFRVMPRMLRDHLPENVYDALETVLHEQKKAQNEHVPVLVIENY